MSTTTPLLEARDLSKLYRSRRGSVLALDSVSLAVEAGAAVGVVGESGSGKSTLARLLVALEQPSEGCVLYRGERVSGRREKELIEFRRRAQVVFQDPMSSLDPRMRIYDILAEPLRALSVPGDHRERVAALLECVELSPDALKRYPHQFSGGQRQRVAIARALAPSPEVLVADEPVSALDVSVRAQILNLLASLVRDFELTLVLISHDLAVVRHLCSSVAVLYRGHLVEAGPTERIFQSPEHGYTKELLAAVPRARAGRARPL
jgi:ABC-type glutathione transport system ATPase component